MKLSLVLICLILGLGSPVWAQQQSPIPATPVQAVLPFYSLTPISATAAINTQTTLTIPAPTSGLFNYVCYLAFNASQTATGALLSNNVTTSTNFSSFALKFSLVAAAATTAITDYDWSANWGNPATGCVKSALAATATTFVSPAAATQTAFTWYATFFQAP